MTLQLGHFRRLVGIAATSFLLLSISTISSVAETPIAGTSSGVNINGFSQSISAAEDFYEYVNSGWLSETEIPSDQARWGAFSELDELVQQQIREIIESAGSEPTSDAVASGGPSIQVGDLYRSYVNMETRNASGLSPIQPLIDEVQAIQSRQDWIATTSKLDRLGVPHPIGVYVDQDAKRSDRYTIYLTQSGLTLPDRDFYLESEDRYQRIQKAFVDYVALVLDDAGFSSSEELAQKVLDFETEIARAQWTKVALRDPIKTYNKVSVEGFAKNHPALSWMEYSKLNGLPAEGDLIIGQPSFFASFNEIVEKTPTDVLKAYTAFQLIDRFSPYLDENRDGRHFAFHGSVLQGVEEQEPLWKRGVQFCNGSLGMPVGQLYVAKHFSPEAKQKMESMVALLKVAFAERIEQLDWMTPATKKRALEKLATFRHKIGYPDRWKDYSSVSIDHENLVGNLMALSDFEHNYQLNKLGKPIDREEWFMPPQMVNAYYNPLMNDIVFPAAILQPPFFNLDADDAVNYGAIGAVIGHEISHGFDDQGSKFDGNGNLQNWWTQKDEEEFSKRASQLVDQYSNYKPFEDMSVNGELTLGENIGDLGGLNAAYSAYRLSLAGNESPILDGLTGDQRFFIGWAQVWRCKYREPELRRRLLTDPHSPTQYRTNGIVVNLDPFYEAFSVPEGSKMYIAPENRVRIW